MRKLVVTTVAAILLASGPMAFAAPHQTTGSIKQFTAGKSLVLQDGSTFQLAKTFKDPGLKVGEKVSVTWDMSGKNKIAESVTVTK
ncbi:DUF1344 domain-containing protein [Aquamicrobium terrae]|uniref:DUF1344 domain-containing protein n=1 Tax=Aquamicrobium terrae TaxID=1324945 RepID=A0ABV2N5W0_9HYPH